MTGRIRVYIILTPKNHPDVGSILLACNPGSASTDDLTELFVDMVNLWRVGGGTGLLDIRPAVENEKVLKSFSYGTDESVEDIIIRHAIACSK